MDTFMGIVVGVLFWAFVFHSMNEDLKHEAE